MIRLDQRLAILVPQFVDAAQAQVQREGEVIHIIAQRLDDLSSMLPASARARTLPIYTASAAPIWSRALSPRSTRPGEKAPSKVKEVFDPNLRIWIGHSSGLPTEGIKVRTRDFR
jgi:error-prone DNA polymerase